MTLPSSVAVIGLGLMGGSLARDLAAMGCNVLGYDSRPEIGPAAERAGVVHVLLDSSLEGARTASLIVIATPVDVAIATLSKLARIVASDATITDVGSTKAAIVARAEELGIGPRFVGSHPLTGDHRSGWRAGRRSLYEGSTVFLCPAPSALPETREAIRGFWESVGASCVNLGAEEHDLRLAWASHLPQVCSSALAATLDTAGLGPEQLGPGGRDATRLAASSPELWRAIALTNAVSLQAAVASLREHLAEFETALRERDSAALLRFFQRASDWARPEA
ncbi:MAG: prephenate dehydrogenase/arogenate dehydrogenase family protein [Gemmatimonas sp.]|nr:prephenate dehydrogenase/arogenate dehydrogenase family protein [Gemmatimonas sp.]